MKRTAFLLTALFLTGCRANVPTATLPPLPVTYLERAHSHNDYLHARPLQDALEHGFGSVEADVHLTANKLLIGHLIAWNPSRTLESLYLDPLRERVRANGGWVYRPNEPFILLVDFKLDARATHEAVHRVLAGYADMLTSVQGGVLKPGAVTVVVTGNRDRELFRKDNPRYFFLDGDLSDLERGESTALVPVVSAEWRTAFRWNGQGDMPDAERQKLHALATKAREQGRKLRLWGAPDTPATWRELLSADAGLINTDNLGGLRDFLLKEDPLVKR